MQLAETEFHKLSKQILWRYVWSQLQQEEIFDNIRDIIFLA